jgi:hypothetical protein
MPTEALPGERSVVLIETLNELEEHLLAGTNIDEGMFNAISMLLVDEVDARATDNWQLGAPPPGVARQSAIRLDREASGDQPRHRRRACRASSSRALLERVRQLEAGRTRDRVGDLSSRS